MKKKNKLTRAQQKAKDFLANHSNPLLQKMAAHIKGGTDPIRPPMGRWEPPTPVDM
jgi:hypothetical protein